MIDARASREAGTLLAVIAALGIKALAADGPILLRRGDIEISGCMRRSRIDPNACFWGMAQRPGCSGACGDAVIESAAQIKLECGWRVSGTAVEARGGSPRSALPVELILAGRSRYRARTAEDGSFRIEVPARAGSRCVETKAFGRMPVEADTPKIVLLGSLSARFRRTHKSLRLRFMTAEKLAAEGVDLAP